MLTNLYEINNFLLAMYNYVANKQANVKLITYYYKALLDFSVEPVL